jgi:hypothetical protein
MTDWEKIAEDEFEAKWSDHPPPEGELVYKSPKDYHRLRPFEPKPELGYYSYLKTSHWAIVRRRALIRAGHQCKGCETTHRLNVHHKTYERLWREEEKDVVVLCRDCHEFVHSLPDLGWTQEEIDRLVTNYPHLIPVVRQRAGTG